MTLLEAAYTPSSHPDRSASWVPSTSLAATRSPAPKHTASPSSPTAPQHGRQPGAMKRGGRTAGTPATGRDRPKGQDRPACRVSTVPMKQQRSPTMKS